MHDNSMRVTPDESKKKRRRCITQYAMLWALTALSDLANAQQILQTRTLDGFDDPSTWRLVTSNQVSGTLRSVDGTDGKALCLDYDFNGVSGYAAIQRDVAIDYPDNYAFAFQLRGDSPANDLQMKFVDASGDNVWWVNRPKYAFPKEWTSVRYKKRQIDKAWGPDPDKVLRSTKKLEFTLYNHVGGKGSVCFDSLQFQRLAAVDDAPLEASASATFTSPGSAPGLAVDGNPGTTWRSTFQGERDAVLTLDLGKVREFGGLSLQWDDDEPATSYAIELSDDARAWRRVREVTQGNGGTDAIALPESEARYLRLSPTNGPSLGFGLREATIEPLAFAATSNDFVRSVAAGSPRGWFPRGFSGEQPYWTIVGLDGGTEQGLIGEDGAVEVAKSGFSIEPFVVADDKLVTWADVRATQSLQDGYLPIPSVDWAHPAFGLRVTAFAEGTPQQSRVVARYRLTNTTAMPRSYVLALAVRPLQVNPPTQFLNTLGGVSPINSLSLHDNGISVEGKLRVRASRIPAAAVAGSFDGGDVVQRLSGMDWKVPSENPSAEARDATGLASGALLYRVTLAPGEHYDVELDAPMTGSFDDRRVASTPVAGDERQARVAAQWRGKLDRLSIRVPVEGQALVDTLRTATAHMLISRIGPRLQPGTRAYARSWIRDGVMISEGLLRMGNPDVVRDYMTWYAPYQFKDGMVPCCVDDRGSDPVPENDSHGELVYGVAEYYRYTGDKAFLQRMWPHVQGAVAYMEKLRLSERTEANRAKNPAFYGMMPVSISHEGYSAKPMHSYWDNFWALRGYKDAVAIAQWLGKDDDVRRFGASRDQFRADLDASLLAAAKLHAIDYLPGSAEQGDFDATSTTIALAPGGEQGRLPEALLRGTFERYWREFEQRADGKREWKDYTPYEWRNVAAFVRLGWRERAWKATQFFFGDRAPQPWNQWAEVVSHTPRKPFFLGDLPHAWVASDFVRSALDMFAYTREVDDSIVLAAGVPATWLDGDGIAVKRLRTPDGELGYSLRRDDGALELKLDEGLRLPDGGAVLPWPFAGTPGETTINGKPTQWTNGELRIQAIPADVRIAMPRSE